MHFTEFPIQSDEVTGSIWTGMDPAMGGDRAAASALGATLTEEDDRRLSLAQRLHRDVSGGLAVCTTLCEMVRMMVESGGDAAMISDSFGKLEQSLRQTAQTAKMITEEQYPLALKAFGLVFALQRLAGSLGSEVGASVSVTSEGKEISLPLGQRFGVYQVLDGLLHHVTGALGARTVSLHGTFSETALEFLLVHDGDDDLSSGTGDEAVLACIRARLPLVGARLLSSCAHPEGVASLRLVIPAPTPAASPSITAPPKLSPLST